MKRVRWCWLVAACLVLAGLAAHALPVEFSVDSAPNVYGSPDWTPWWDATKADTVAGGITDLRTGTFPGTSYIIPVDETVYSFGDLGKRLHWVYWVPGEDVASLDGLLEVKWVVDWYGTDWTYEGGGWAPDGPDVGWSEPTRWEDYGGGTIGSVGFAWWACYPSNDPALLDAELELYWEAQTFALGQVRVRDSVSDPWSVTSIRLEIVPRDVFTFVEEHGLSLDHAFLLASLPGRAAEALLRAMERFGLDIHRILDLLDRFGARSLVRAATFGRSRAEFMRLLMGYEFAAGGGGIEGTFGILPGYTEGESLSISFILLDPVTGEEVDDALVTATICSTPDDGPAAIHFFAVVPFDEERAEYALDIDLSGLAPGAYQLFLGTDDGGVQQVSFEIVSGE
ncbi:MAG: hypothetical protein JSW65_07425 [Candidatus Bipolaricaulota bacterium]|nr:MAG: hypothetical protein JSW65_07425 [Candidatus Bipolaricaulota bacterium]